MIFTFFGKDLYIYIYLMFNNVMFGRNQAEIPNMSPGVCVSLGGRTLQVLRARVSDGGKYTCLAVNPAGEARKIIFLTVFGQH